MRRKMLEGYIVIVCLALVFMLADAFIQEAHELKAYQAEEAKKASSVADSDFSFRDPAPTPDSRPTKTPSKYPNPTPTPDPPTDRPDTTDHPPRYIDPTPTPAPVSLPTAQIVVDDDCGDYDPHNP